MNNNNKNKITTGQDAEKRRMFENIFSAKMQTYIIFVLIGAFLVPGCSSKEGKSMTEQEIIELVKLYQQGAGADDVAGPQLRIGGEQTKQILIKLLDDPTTQEQLVGTIAQILHVYFPCDESYDAMDRFANRIDDINEREKTQQMMKALRSMPRER